MICDACMYRPALIVLDVRPLLDPKDTNTEPGTRDAPTTIGLCGLCVEDGRRRAVDSITTTQQCDYYDEHGYFCQREKHGREIEHTTERTATLVDHWRSLAARNCVEAATQRAAGFARDADRLEWIATAQRSCAADLDARLQSSTKNSGEKPA